MKTNNEFDNKMQEVIAMFWEHVKQNKALNRQKNKINNMGYHTPDIRNEFVTYIEYLRNNSIISDDLAQIVKLKP